MKVLILHLIYFSLLSLDPAESKKKTKKFPVSGTVTSTINYCGGARPTAEILEQAATPRPIPHKKIYIKQGDVNSFGSKTILQLTTDSNGNFKAKLPAGKYLVVDSTKNDLLYYNMLLKTYKSQTTNYEAVDTLCLKEWYMKPNCVFEVTDKEVNNINVNFHKTCDDIPCSRYRGPFKE